MYPKNTKKPTAKSMHDLQQAVLSATPTLTLCSAFGTSNNSSLSILMTLYFLREILSKASDFDEPPADPYHRSTPSPSPEPWPIFDEIVVQPPLALQAFKTYKDFQPDNDSPSFTNVVQRYDAKLWWDIFCDEIKAIIVWKTWSLIRLPYERHALPMR